MHNNANIMCQLMDSAAVQQTCLDLQPKTSGGGGGMTPDEMVVDLATNFEDAMPAAMKREDAGEKLCFWIGQNPDSVTNFLMQEVDRFNKLVKVLSSTLSNIKKAIKGLVLMSSALGALYYSFLKNEVPAVWTKAS
jgi:dynein heavy chain